MRYPNIEAERARNDMTNEELAKRLRVSRKTLYNWQKNGSIPAAKVIELCAMFNCSADYLLGREVANAAPDP